MVRSLSRLSRFLVWIVFAAVLTACAQPPSQPSQPSAVQSGEVPAEASALVLEREVILTDRAPQPIGPYSQAIRVGAMLFVSGQIGADPDTRRLVDGGVEAEARQALYNVQAILQAAGADLQHVAQCQVFLVDIGDYAAVNAVYGSFFSEDPPARAALQVSALPAGAQVEILCTAVHRG